MTRLVTAAALLTLLAMAASSPAATNEVRLCGTSATGWEVTAGNYPAGGVPKTRCSFAWATYRKVQAKRSNSGLPSQFPLEVRGQKLTCRASSGHLDEIHCKNAHRFVLIYRSD
jgi:hypothetical protein